MIGISKLYCGTVEPSDALRYGRDSSKLPSHLLQFSKDKKPVVVWNMGRRCNLKCVHCYAHSKDIEYRTNSRPSRVRSLSMTLPSSARLLFFFRAANLQCEKTFLNLRYMQGQKECGLSFQRTGRLSIKKWLKS